MISVSATDDWRTSHGGAIIGLLELANVVNTGSASALETRKRALESRLREDFAGGDRQAMLTDPILSAYRAYYKRFKKTYHVQLQLESIALHGKNLPAVSPLVDSNFAAEMETFVLTAAHDAVKLQGQVQIDVSREGELVNLMGGKSKAIHAGDMVMRDREGVCCSIIYGQDDRSPVTLRTSDVLYVSYAPIGVPAERVSAQLDAIESNVRLFCPDAGTAQKRLIEAG